MNKSFSTIKSNIGTLIQDTSDAMDTNIGVWVNNRYRDILSRYEWDELIHNFSLTSTASVSACPLDEDVDRLMFVLDSTNGGYLAIDSEQQFYQENYDVFNSTGTPERCFIKYDVVRSQPASAIAPTVKSSSASDTSQTVFLRGISSNSEVYESLLLSGTSVVSASNTYSRLLGISKSGSTVGKVTIMENDESTVLSVLAMEQLESRYKQLHLHFIPTGTIVYHIKAMRRILPLSQDYDYPVINEAADILELGGTADALRYKRQFMKAREYEFLYEKAISEKLFKRMSQPGQVIMLSPSALNRDDGIL